MPKQKKHRHGDSHQFLAEEVHRPGRWSFWMAALLFSIIFAGGHLSNPDENKSGIIMVFIDGTNMCFTLWRTGNLWFAIGNHAAWDWVRHSCSAHPIAARMGSSTCPARSTRRKSVSADFSSFSRDSRGRRHCNWIPESHGLGQDGLRHELDDMSHLHPVVCTCALHRIGSVLAGVTAYAFHCSDVLFHSSQFGTVR